MAMEKRGIISEETTPDVEGRLKEKRATDDPKARIRALDDDLTHRLADKAADAIKPTK